MPDDKIIVYNLDINAIIKPTVVRTNIFSFLNLRPIIIDTSPLKNSKIVIGPKNEL